MSLPVKKGLVSNSFTPGDAMMDFCVNKWFTGRACLHLDERVNFMECDEDSEGIIITERDRFLAFVN